MLASGIGRDAHVGIPWGQALEDVRRRTCARSYNSMNGTNVAKGGLYRKRSDGQIPRASGFGGG